MAIITNLTNLSLDIEVAKTGYFNQFEYGNLGMINANHNNLYPILHLLPPTSVIIDPYKNAEQLTCIFHCYRPILKDTGDTTKGVNAQEYQLEKTHDDLFQRFIGTMQNVFLGNEPKYTMVQQWTMERVNEEFNDGLVGIIITVTIERYAMCLQYDEDNVVAAGSPTP